MLPTEKTSGFYLYNYKLFKGNFGHYINQHLYIVSDEEIKEGDWCYNYVLDSITQIKSGDVNFLAERYYLKHAKKIIATTDKYLSSETNNPIQQLPQIPELFIEIYIEYFNSNKPITEVEIEYEEFDKKKVCVGMEGKPAKPIYNYIGEHRLKLQKDNTIEISLVENNSIGTYIAVFTDGEYKNIVIVQAKNTNEAETKLKDQGWKGWDRLELVEYDEKGICFAINGLR